jgi:hypothetical protein
MSTSFTIFLFSVVTSFLFFVPNVYAAELSLIIPSQSIETGDTFAVDVLLDTRNEAVNAVELFIDFPSELISLVEYEFKESPILFWVEKPVVTESGTIRLSGVIPGGITTSYTRLVRLHFKANDSGQGILSVGDAHVLLHDGLGTEAYVATSSIHFVVKEQVPSTATLNSNTLYADAEAPNPFELLLLQDADVLNNQKFIVFDTEDTGSGIDYYEVKEKPFGMYKRATSPYLLHDQEPGKYVSVRAVDKAGNKYTAYLYPQTMRPVSLLTIVIGILVVCLFGLISSKKIRTFLGGKII